MNQRVESFRYWVVPWIDVRELAYNGFYYAPWVSDDAVTCYFCDLTLHRWEANDIIHNDHLSWAPHCIMNRGQRPITPTTYDWNLEPERRNIDETNVIIEN